MRLQKFLSRAGIASRRQAEKMIQQGKVKLNGEVVTRMGVKIDANQDEVRVNNKVVTLPEEYLYVMLNKPSGYITTADDPQDRSTVYDLLPEKYHHLFPVGRLDKDTQGLLLFTNDGDLAQKLTHPKYEHTKQYLVKVDHQINAQFVQQLKHGVQLDEGTATADEAELVDDYSFTISLHQGWKRQIRRMVKSLDAQVVELTRIRIENFKLKQMGQKSVKKIDKQDIIS